jgi:hypothetical protein
MDRHPEVFQMKKILTAALLAALTGGIALAQSAPPMSAHMAPPDPARMHQMMQVHDQARAAILAALSPAHKALFAQVTGQLAVAAHPDADAAAARLNAALSATEKQKIMAAAQSAMAKMHAMMPPPGHDGMPADHAMRSMTAGDILLMLARLSIMPEHRP